MPKKKLKHTYSIFPVFKPVRVKYKDVFDFKGFYEDLHEWLEEHGWKDVEEDSDHYETYYGERIGQSGAKEIWIQWRPYRAAEDGKFTFYLDFDYHIIGLTKMEIVKEGRKISLNKGEVDLYIRPYNELNFLKEMEAHPVLKHLVTLFKKRIYRRVIKQREKELYQETYELQNWIKQWFKLKRHLPYEESKTFFPSQAWPSHLKEE